MEDLRPVEHLQEDRHRVTLYRYRGAEGPTFVFAAFTFRRRGEQWTCDQPVTRGELATLEQVFNRAQHRCDQLQDFARHFDR